MTQLSQKPIQCYATSSNHNFEPHPHQKAAWDELDKHFLQRDAKAGIVVPTGGGKTSIAVYWLLRQHVAKGGRVLWLAHRRGLLWQARNDFGRLVSLAAPKERLGTAVVASNALSWSSVVADHDMVLSSVQSVVREHSLGSVDAMAAQSPGGFFIDEAHHGAAPSYPTVVQAARDSGARVLGLTATPAQMNPDDERRRHHAVLPLPVPLPSPLSVASRGPARREQVAHFSAAAELEVRCVRPAECAKATVACRGGRRAACGAAGSSRAAESVARGAGSVA